MIPCGPLPLISPWLYRRSIKRIVRRAKNGDVEAVSELAEVFCTTPDPKARDLAREGLTSLSSSEQIDLLCRIILTRDNPDLLAMANHCGFLPSVPAYHALYRFCTSGSGKSGKPNSEVSADLLAEGYAGASAQVRAMARRVARMNGTGSILARSLTGTCVTEYASNWSFDEWEIVINGLIREQKWADLWVP